MSLVSRLAQAYVRHVGSLDTLGPKTRNYILSASLAGEITNPSSPSSRDYGIGMKIGTSLLALLSAYKLIPAIVYAQQEANQTQQPKLYRLNPDGTKTDVSADVIGPLTQEGGTLDRLARGNFDDSSDDYVLGKIISSGSGQPRHTWRATPPSASRSVNVEQTIENGVGFKPDKIFYLKIRYGGEIFNVGILVSPDNNRSDARNLNTGVSYGDIRGLLGNPQEIVGVNTTNQGNSSPEHEVLYLRYDIQGPKKWRMYPGGHDVDLESIVEQYYGIPKAQIKQLLALKLNGSPVDQYYALVASPRGGDGSDSTPQPTPTPQLVLVPQTGNFVGGQFPGNQFPLNLLDNQQYNVIVVVAGVNQPSQYYTPPLNLEWIITRGNTTFPPIHSSGIGPTVSLSFPPEELIESVPPGIRILTPGDYSVNLRVRDASGLEGRLFWGTIRVFGSDSSSGGAQPGGGGPPPPPCPPVC